MSDEELREIAKTLSLARPTTTWEADDAIREVHDRTRRETLEEAANYIRERELFLRAEERHESAGYFHFAHQELLRRSEAGKWSRLHD